MDKFLLKTFVAAFGLALSTMSFADNVKVDGYHLQKSASANTALTRKATDITINNYAYDNFYIVIPNSPINDVLYPGTYYRVFSDHFYGDTHLVLEDMYRRPFFDGYVCRYAMVAVSGNRYNFNVNIDRSACY